jgi:hypothetical protein
MAEFDCAIQAGVALWRRDIIHPDLQQLTCQCARAPVGPTWASTSNEPNIPADTYSCYEISGLVQSRTVSAADGNAGLLRPLAEAQAV